MRLFCEKQPCLVKIRDRGGNKENGNVEPIGRFTNHAVVGVEEYGDHKEPQKDSAKLYAPKIRALTEEKAVHYGKEKHWPKEQLHVLPG